MFGRWKNKQDVIFENEIKNYFNYSSFISIRTSQYINTTKSTGIALQANSWIKYESMTICTSNTYPDPLHSVLWASKYVHFGLSRTIKMNLNMLFSSAVESISQYKWCTFQILTFEIFVACEFQFPSLSIFFLLIQTNTKLWYKEFRLICLRLVHFRNLLQVNCIISIRN